MTVLYYILSFLAGALLAAVFTGGLWVTVQKMTVSNRPYLLAVGSFFLRTALVMSGLYLLLQAGWQHMLAGLVGFVIAKTIIAGRLSKYDLHKQNKEGKTNHDY